MTTTSPTRVRTADGTALAVRQLIRDGDADEGLIVALHGFTGNGSTMEPLVQRVRSGRSALLVDLVGHGDSDAPEYLEPYSMSSVVDQVLSIIGERPPGTVHLLGYSMGGRVALSMAARAPWYFASVALLSSTPGIEDPVARAERYDADQSLADRIEREGLEAFFDWWLALPLFASMVQSIGADALAATVAQRLTSSPLGLANSLRGTGTGSMPPLWNSLRSLRSPLLAVAGADDPAYAEIAKQIDDRAPMGRSAIVDDAGHALHVENPEGVSHVLREFLEGCERSAP